MDAAHGPLRRDSKKKRKIPIVLVSVGHYYSIRNKVLYHGRTAAVNTKDF